MERPPDPRRLGPNDWERIRERADRFEEAWRCGDDVDLAPFLPPSDDPLRRPALEELIKTDLEVRWRRGRPIDLEYYLVKFPELGDPASVSPRLVYEEYLARQRFGDKLPLAVYRQRFPAQFEEVQRFAAEERVSSGSIDLTAPPPDDLPAPVVLRMGDLIEVGGGYRLVRRIGRGSFGEVWQAEAPGGFPAAVKIITRTLDDQEAQRELHALDLIKRLNHPFLLRTTASWALRDRLIILMELADGSLRDRLAYWQRKGQPAGDGAAAAPPPGDGPPAAMSGIPPDELIRYFYEAADALDYLHGEHVLHRDIKPDNILLCNGRVKVGDFGLVRQHNQLLISVSAAGTPAYMPPEVWRGKYGASSDQYSLAYTYAELRLGRRPFGSTDYAAVMFAHLQAVPDLSPLGEAEQEVLHRALAKETAQRFASCGEWVRELEKALARDRSRPDRAGGVSPRSGGRGEATRPLSSGSQSALRTPPAGVAVAAPLVTATPRSAGPAAPASPDILATTADVSSSALESSVVDLGIVEESGPQALELPSPSKASAPPPPKGRGVVSPTAESRSAPATRGEVSAGPGWRPERQPNRVVIAGLLLTAFLVPAGLVALWRYGQSGQVVLPPPEAVTLAAGSRKGVAVRIERMGYEGPVEITAECSPGLSCVGATIPPGGGQAELTVVAAPEAPPGPGRLTLRAAVPKGDGGRWRPPLFRTDGDREALDLEVHVLPAGFRPAEGAVLDREGTPYYSRIVRRCGKERVVFVLLRPAGKDDPEAFYLMENKVWNRLFGWFADRDPQAVQGSQWRRGGRADGEDVGALNARLPALRVTRAEAEACAARLGGRLPSVAELDRAAGLGRGRDRPSRGLRVAVGRRKEGPWEVDNPDNEDVSPAGIRDLSGNGWEWTRDVLWVRGEEYAVLRGRSYTAWRPLLPSELVERRRPELQPTQSPSTSSPYTGFRVAIGLP